MTIKMQQTVKLSVKSCQNTLLLFNFNIHISAYNKFDRSEDSCLYFLSLAPV